MGTPTPEAPQDGAHPTLDPLLAASGPVPGHWDERIGPGGEVRPAWQAFLRATAPLSPDALVHAAQRVERQIRANGVTYNVYADDDGSSRRWSLDVVPELLSQNDWEPLERGARQFVRLMNRMAADVYGPQCLINEGVIPPALVFRHPGFLRACHDARPHDGVLLHIAALDVMRDAEGMWRLAGSRLQAPSGLGDVLENRSTIGDVFPDALRALRVKPLVPFYEAVKDLLSAAAPVDDGGPPRVVLLTPGPFSQTYFEHVYLARELGLPLVQGSDLVVRNDRVFLKTVAGLRRVHAVWRRQDDDSCDPLELQPDSVLGVPGLVQAWRTGHVLVTNGFGAGVLESPALCPYLPAICDRLLGEPLQLALADTWWCGEAEGRRIADQPGGGYLVAPAFPDTALRIVPRGSPGSEAFPLAQIAARPTEYVIRAQLPFSQAPVWRDGAIRSLPLVLRVFLLADGHGDYRVLPGGLARVADDERDIAWGRGGNRSKDTWVLSAPDDDADDGLSAAARPRRPLAHGERTTSSRAAENLFWLGRYAERSENDARLLRAVLGRLGQIRAQPAAFRSCVLHTCRTQGLLRADELPSRPSEMDDDLMTSVEHLLLAGLTDRETRQSVAFNIASTWRVAGEVRERLSSDNWRVLNRLLQDVAPQASRLETHEALELLDDAIVSLVAVGGLEMAHMTRDEGWRFLSLGRHLERLAFVAETLETVTLHRAMHEPAVLEWLLDVSDSLITYRARYFGPPEWPAILDLLFFDERNPRAGMFQVAKVAKHVALLPGSDPLEVLGEIDALHSAGRVSADGDHDIFGSEIALDYLPRAARRLAERVSDALTLRYFSHAYESPLATVTA